MSEVGHQGRTPPRMLEVQATTRISPRLQRVTLGGPELEGFPPGREGAHIKLFLPQEHQRQPVLPTLGPDGPIWPPRDQRPITRTYSVRRFDPERCLLDVEFVLHGDAGPASAWAARARPGDAIGLAGPGGPDPMVGEADWYLFVGDLSAVPAITALMEELPDDATGVALLEAPDEDDFLSLPGPSGFSVEWLVTGGAGSVLPERVAAMDWPDHMAPFAWVAGENAMVIALRQHLRHERGLCRSAIYAVPYWKRSASEEAYHEERHRVMDNMETD